MIALRETSNMKRKVILTCAVTGNAPFNPKHPSFPVTPKEIAASAIEVAKAGASIAHIHVRDPETAEGSRDVGLFAETVRTSSCILMNDAG